MDNIVFWVALIGVIGTLGGVYLGNWLQGRNIKQQREWMLQDQKREWVRRQKQEKFERILMHLDETQKCLLKVKLLLSKPTLDDAITNEIKELLLKYAEHSASVTAISYVVKHEDEKLADLVSKYSLVLARMLKNFTSKRFEEFVQENQSLLELTGQIQQLVEELLEKTFD